MQSLAEGLRELSTGLPQVATYVMRERGFMSLASRLATRLLKHGEEPMEKLAQVHAASKGLVAAYSVKSGQGNARVSDTTASVLRAAEEARGADEFLAKNLVGNINLQRSQFLLRHGKLGAAAAHLPEPSWPECVHTIACRHDAACALPTHPTHPTHCLPDPPRFHGGCAPPLAPDPL